MWSAKVLRAARRRAGLTQRDLAQRTGISRSTIVRIESGKIDTRASTLRSLLAGCDVDLEPMPAIGRGVDRSQILERLKMTPAERIRALTQAAAAMSRIQGRAAHKAAAAVVDAADVDDEPQEPS
jgi:transcriptional regulator with XRE-family HTH domain